MSSSGTQTHTGGGRLTGQTVGCGTHTRKQGALCVCREQTRSHQDLSWSVRQGSPAFHLKTHINQGSRLWIWLDRSVSFSSFTLSTLRVQPHRVVFRYKAPGLGAWVCVRVFGFIVQGGLTCDSDPQSPDSSQESRDKSLRVGVPGDRSVCSLLSLSL